MKLGTASWEVSVMPPADEESVITVMIPVVARYGTPVTVMEVPAAFTEKLPAALTALNCTSTVPAKPVPVMLTTVGAGFGGAPGPPALPALGVKETILGETTKRCVLVVEPLGVVTVIGPGAAGPGTLAVMVFAF